MHNQQEITKELLKSYTSNKEEIAELKYQMGHSGEGDTMIGSDTILDYRKGYPVPQAVVGIDWDKVDRTKLRYQRRISLLEAECQQAEEFIENIPDSLTRRIFRMRYIEGLPQKRIADSTHMDRSRISRKIDDYLKNAHKAQKAHL